MHHSQLEGISHMARTYYTLITREPGEDRFYPQFGDYVRAVVLQEIADMKESSSHIRA